MPDARLPRHDQAHRADRPLDLLLPGVPEIERICSKERAEAPMAYENILVETKGKVGVIRLNRPQALNALNTKLKAELSAAIDAFEADANIACMVITGSEKAF